MKKIAMFVFAIVAGTVLSAGGLLADAGQQESWPPAPSTIVGAWQVETTVRVNAADCTTAAPVPVGLNPFPGLSTFHAGGTVSETGSRSPPSRRSPGHGVWRRTGGKTYDARYTFQVFDTNGFQSNIMDVRSAITLSADGDSFTGVSRFLFSDISGNTMPFCATHDGVRFSL